eukprot:scaffold83090_cov48-Phaeocystis_antarctica.AAC.3
MRYLIYLSATMSDRSSWLRLPPLMPPAPKMTIASIASGSRSPQRRPPAVGAQSKLPGGRVIWMCANWRYDVH